MIETLQAIETEFLLFVQNSIRTPFLNKFFAFFTTLGNAGVIWLVAGVGMLIPKKTRRSGLILLLCMLIEYLIDDLLIKNIFARPRPYNSISELVTLVNPLKSYSFPSGHASAAFAFATSLTVLYGKKVAWVFIPAVLMAFSRVYCGMHYPVDVLGGMLFGTIVSLIATKILDRKLSPEIGVKKNS